MQVPDNCLVLSIVLLLIFWKQTSVDHTGRGRAGVHLPPVSGPPKLSLSDHPIQDLVSGVSVTKKQGQSSVVALSVPDKLQGLPNQASLVPASQLPLICAYFPNLQPFPEFRELFDILSVNSFLLRLARWISFVFNKEP